MTSYAELDALTAFSFLEGGALPEEMVAQAAALGHTAIGVADRNTLAGVVRAHVAAEKAGLRLLVGCRLVFREGGELIVYPRDRAAYGRLCRLLSQGKMGDVPKGECHISFAQAAEIGAGLVALVPDRHVDHLRDWARAWPDRLLLALAPRYDGQDRARLNRLAALARDAGVATVATNAALYHTPARRPLQDVLTCIREGVTIDEAGFRLQANAERFLKPGLEMARLFAGHAEALARTREVVAACAFSLNDLRYEYPDEPVPPGKTALQHLTDLTWAGAARIYGPDLPDKLRETLNKELALIETLSYAHYFLTVHDVVAWARGQGILCQGRGSAANSAVCFCLGITAVDPTEQDLLVERFMSANRTEPPDIDVDFEHERREEVIQYVYRRYGRARAALCATVIHYRPRSAIREVGKALGLTEDVTAALADTVWGSHGEGVEDAHVDALGLKRQDRRLRQALALARELVGFPRHLSQHVGGFVLTQGPLVETVPVGNAAMEDRTFIEWDKDDIDALHIMKVDVLALGMLTALRKSFTLIREQFGEDLTLATVPQGDEQVYDMLCRADSLGLFQVESRAQMAMLPRLRPRVFYDLVVQVAIVRPGPIQGNMVHPYLNRRAERRAAQAKGQGYDIDLPSPADPACAEELKPVLSKTLGVPLFQEQAMRIAMVAAEFTGDEANGLRRAMATFRNRGTMHEYEEMMVGRMIGRGYDPDFARNCFEQIKGFGEYGFPESHAASFAVLVYVSAWIKCHYPAVFAAALLNSQPMGFYAPAQIVRDARAHEVEVRPPEVNASDWDCTIEDDALRLGLRQIGGFREDWAQAIAAARPFPTLEALRDRAGLPGRALELLAAADALASLNLGRRQALWGARGLPAEKPLPLFAAADEADGPAPPALPALRAAEEVVQDYETLRLSLKAHPISFLRDRLAALRALPCAAVETAPVNRRTTLGGVVLVRQRPGSAKGVCFITIEDETGVANIVVWPSVFEEFRPVIMTARMLLVHGRPQRAEGVTHLVADRLEDWSWALDLLSANLRPATAHGDAAASSSPDAHEASTRRHPRDVRVIPKSRDFH